MVIRIRSFIPPLLLLFASGIGTAAMADGWVDISSNRTRSGSDPRYLVRRIRKDDIISFLDIKHTTRNFYIRYAYNCMKKQSKITAIHKGTYASLQRTVDGWRDVKVGSIEEIRWTYACLGRKP